MSDEVNTVEALEEYRRVWPGGEISRLAAAAIASMVAADREYMDSAEKRIAELEDELEAAQIGETAQKKRAERLQRMVDTSEYDPSHPGIFWKGLYEQAEADLSAASEHIAEVGKKVEQAEADAKKWEWLATHEYRCPLDEMRPGEPGSYIIVVPVHDALIAAWAERGTE